MKSNFEFLQERFPLLSKLGSLAEFYLYSDVNACLIKVGMFGENVVNLILKLDGLDPAKPEINQHKRINYLKKQGLLPKEIDDILYALRIARNKAVHDNEEDAEKSKILITMTHTLGIWFMQTYGESTYIPKDYVYLENGRIDYKKQCDDIEKMVEKLLEDNQKLKADDVTPSERAKRSESAVTQIKMNEKQTRYLIDEQLRQAGWEVDTDILRYSKGIRPEKNKNRAIAEWPVNSSVKKYGYADYALFVGLELYGLIEAKRANIDIPSIINVQCRDYAEHIKKEHEKYVISTWGAYRVPFVYATNGSKYLKQLETKSGIWFLDLRNQSNLAKALQGFPSPQGIKELMEKDVDKASKKLIEMPYDILRDKNGMSLRYYQIEAIQAVEQALDHGATTALLSMATGTGKTRTILGMIYRFIKTKRFTRILFLVDRTSLGEQANETFEDIKIEGTDTLNDMYDLKGLGDKEFGSETKVHLATVQSLVKRILYNEKEEKPAVSDYDLIIVDEAHRGYVLDKELSEDEIEYRNHDDFIGKYRSVLEYFDAIKVAMTATPAKHTTQIFGMPVYEYSYRKAVIDDFLVDHNPPHHLVTKLSHHGINYDIGEQVEILDKVTKEVTTSAQLEDELRFELDQFNKAVITESFNVAVLKEICDCIDLEGEGKTLIYAVNNDHADMIVNILHKIIKDRVCEYDNQHVAKITAKIGDSKYVIEQIKKFKNEKAPNIVVTVDLLTTGIDIPKINALVFLRPVKSRILFEQMLGRATRLCEEIGKTHFQIFDPVDIYANLQPVSTMRPMVTSSSASFGDLIKGLETFTTKDQVQNQIDLIIAKIRRRQYNMTDKQMKKFKGITEGKDPKQFIENLVSLPIDQRKKLLLSSNDLFQILIEEGKSRVNGIVISHKEDELLSHTRGYGKGQKPKDYIEEFTQFIHENRDKIEILNLVCTRPADLTRKDLISLRFQLDSHSFNELQLNSAFSEMKNEEIASNIIHIIRSLALGNPLLNHKERVEKAVWNLKKVNTFTGTELNWLNRIEKHLIKETIIEIEDFEQGAFKSKGGFHIINKVFSGKLEKYIVELNHYLYDDGGQVA